MKKSTNTLFFSFLLQIYLLTNMIVVTEAQNRKISVKVGVVLDDNEAVGRMGLRCIRMAISDFYSSSEGRSYKTRIVVHSRDSNSEVVGAASSALDLIKNTQVQAIIGPLKSSQASFVVDLGEKAKFSIISFSAMCPSLTTRSSYFFRATGNEASQAEAIASLVRAFGWKQVVPVYASDAYGKGFVPFLVDALLRVGVHVPYRSAINPSASDETLQKTLEGLKAKPVRVFVVQTYTSLGKKIFAEAERVRMMSEGFVWIVTSGMANLFETSSLTLGDSMNGVLGIRSYIPRTKEVEIFKYQYRKKRFEDGDQEVNVFGLWAYDAAKALIMAVERTWGSNGNDDYAWKFKAVNNYSNDLNSFGASFNGQKIRDTFANVKFKGLAGNFSLVHEELQVSAYEIVNVDNSGVVNVVGFWKPKHGLIRDLNSSPKTNNPHYITTTDNLGLITWPGGTNKDPKGWEIPIINGTRRLKVGVPLKGGFKEFVNVTYNSDNTTNISGYCINIFKEVINSLPYKVAYELVPFANSSHEPNGTYDDLVYQVFLKNFDAVIGDVTIRSNRSLYVDFTLPFMESGVSMIVTVKDERNKNAWVFIKPLTWDLWVAIVCFFVFIGFVVWVNEHQINKDFRGSLSHQIGTSLWFSFSTMVFAARERVFSNSSRFVIIIWVFVVLILTQSYTASLTSLLTVQQLKPAITNITTLIKDSKNVGYLEASFIREMLKNLGLKESQLKVYKSAKDLARAFSANEIVAAFDEKPYMDVFLGMYCSKYTMIGPTFKTLGFGFAFPRGSPLVSDVSQAILNITESGKSKNITALWFGEKERCPNPSSQDASNSLGLESFWGLFLIATIAALFGLALNGVTFFCRYWNVIKGSIRPEATLWEKICVMFRVFDQKDLNSHAFKRTTNYQMSELQSHFSSARNDNVVVPIDGATLNSNAGVI